jgi:hypothetical protein
MRNYGYDNSELDAPPYEQFREYVVKGEVTIGTVDYQHIRQVVEDAFESGGFSSIEEVYARCVGDCCRVYAVLGRHKDELYREIVALKARLR